MVVGDSAGENEPLFYKQQDIDGLPAETLREALREAAGAITELRALVAEDSREASEREEHFQRQLISRHDYFGTVAEYQSRLFDASSAYNQIIIIGGFAAFFGVLSAVAKDIDPLVRLTAAGLILLSVTIYVSWVVISMTTLQSHNLATLATFSEGEEGFEERYRASVAANHAKSNKIQRFWKPVVWSAGLSGFGAAMVLGAATMWALLDLPAAKPVPDSATVAAVASAKAAARDAACSAKTVAMLTQARSGPGSRAINEKTGDLFVVVDGKWVSLPRCGLGPAK